MSNISLNAKTIFNYGDFCEVLDFCSDDSPQAIEKFKTFYHSGNDQEFLNGYDATRNILMSAATFANVHLVRHIVENAHPTILDLRDNLGYTALHYAVKSRGSTEKVLECVHILIEAGANMESRWFYNPAQSPSNSEQDFIGDNALGFIVSKLASSLHPKERERYEALAQLFLSYGAKKGYDSRRDESGKDTGWFSVEERYDERDVSQRAKNGRILQAIEALRWSKDRLLFLGNKDQGSQLSELPKDLVKLIYTQYL